MNMTTTREQAIIDAVDQLINGGDSTAIVALTAIAPAVKWRDVEAIVDAGPVPAHLAMRSPTYRVAQYVAEVAAQTKIVRDYLGVDAATFLDRHDDDREFPRNGYGAAALVEHVEDERDTEVRGLCAYLTILALGPAAR